MRRSVITGMGIWSCIGRDVQEVERSLRNGKSGITVDPARSDYGYQSPLTGRVPRPDLKNENLRRAQRICMGEPAEYAYMAVKQALAQSGITDLQSCALIVSNDSTANALAETESIMQLHHDTRRLGAGRVFQCLNSTVSMSLAAVFGIGGLSLSVSAACAGGGHAIGIAHTLIRSGVIDCAIVVGAQEVGLHAYTSFDALGVFSRQTDNPAAASRPFDAARDGLVPSGGAACIILESEAHYAARTASRPAPVVSSAASSVPAGSASGVSSIAGAASTEKAPVPSGSPLGYITGYGFSTSPNIVSPSSESILRAMTAALEDADTSPAALDLILAHATGTRDGDTAEAEAISSVCRDAIATKAPVPCGFPQGPYVATTKALTGHECWMSGVSQVVYAIIQMQGNFIAPHPNLSQPDKVAANLRIPRAATVTTIRTALCNAFGFGGTNASLVITK